MSDVFISYSRHQRAVAKELAEELTRRGLTVWYDQLVPPAANFQSMLDENLRAARSIVTLWGKDAAKSHWVMAEIGFAYVQKNLVLVALDDTDLPMDLALGPSHKWAGRPIAQLADEILPTLQARSGRIAADAPQTSKAPEPKNRGFAFLSFCAEDYEFVEELKAYLTTEGFLSWDYNSGERDVEKLLSLELEAKIQESVVLICVVSPEWKKSTWSAREYFFAKEINRPVFIVECEKLEPTLAIAGEHRIRFWGERRSAGFELLSRELKRRGL